MAGGGRMDTNLVGATGLEAGLDQAHSIGLCEAFKMGGSCLSVDFHGPCAGLSGVSSHDGQVFSFDPVLFKGLADRLVDASVKGKKDQPRCWRVQPVVQSNI